MTCTLEEKTAPWYVRSFGRDYVAIYAHRNLDEARENARHLVALIEPPLHGPLLDLACGAGRHLRALRELGYEQMVGVDLSPELLALARQNLMVDPQGRNPGGETPLVRADMRAIPFSDHFATVLSLFTSFGYFSSDTENAAVMKEVHRALRPGGVFLIDYINRPLVLARLVPQDERLYGEWRIHNARRITPDGSRVEKTTRVIGSDGRARIFDESVRLYTQEELGWMLSEAGFERLRVYGSLRGEPYSESSPRMVWVAYKEHAA